MVASDERVTIEPPPVISAIRTARCASLCASAAVRASLSVAYTANSSPACGTVARPITCAAMDGPAVGMPLPRSFSSVRTCARVGGWAGEGEEV